MFKSILRKSTLDLSIFLSNKMNLQENSGLYKRLFDKVEGIEKNVYSMLLEIQTVKECLLDLKGQGTATAVRSFSTLSTATSSSLKRRKPIHDEISDLQNDVIDFGDDDFSNDESSSKKIKDDFKYTDGYVQVYTDGACENNGKANAKAGLGVWFGPNHRLNVSKPVTGRATNNVGEIQACMCALKIASKAGVKKICINTDSQFVINSMTKWLAGWKRKGWKLADGGPVKNKEDFTQLDLATKLMTDIKWNYVRGHCGIEGNEGADELARKGAELYKK